ncbi:nucleotidyltransferase family protein [Azospirillum sp. Sh1]|uniref:nucleotidyltransferase domain-containing protein n=1 Tax=Azospirillum sp. Sh1 TaxID=2607285 RepID=UPI00165E1B53|nr:nucleotidyltransferase family protein [Azospirillum sp. Sh1]
MAGAAMGAAGTETADRTAGLGFSVADLPPAQRYLVAALSARFGGRAHPLPADPDWREVGCLARYHRLAPLMDRAFLPGAPDAWLTEIAEWRRAEIRRSLLLTARMLEVARCFRQAGVDLLVLKGPAQAVRLFGDAHARSCRDIDLLVRPAQADEALRLLRGLGYGTRPDLLSRHVNAIFAAHEDGGPPVELHTQLSEGNVVFSSRALDPFRESAELDIGGRTVRSLSPGATIAYAAYHGARHHWSLLYWFADLVAATRRPAADWEDAAAVAARCGTGRHLAMAVRLVRGLTGLSPPVPPPCPSGDLPVLRRAEAVVGAIWALPPMEENEALRRLGTIAVLRSDLSLYRGRMAAARYLLALLRPTDSDNPGLPLSSGMRFLLLPLRIIRVLAMELSRGRP